MARITTDASKPYCYACDGDGWIMHLSQKPPFDTYSVRCHCNPEPVEVGPKRYVMGFAIQHAIFQDPGKALVLLVEKDETHPSGAGLNGVGGKIEPGETAEQAMDREWREETGRNAIRWVHYGRLCGEGWEVELFSSTDRHGASDKEPTELIHQQEIERVLTRSGLCRHAAVALAAALHTPRGELVTIRV